MTSVAVEFEQGTQTFLTEKITALLPALNADLAQKVVSLAAPPVFEHKIGDIPSVSGPRLCTYMLSNGPRRTAQNQKVITVMFNILALIPTAGDNTAMNFEMARQVSAAHILTLFDDDSQVLTPKISAGLIGAVSALEGERGDLVDIWPRKMADGVTTVRGWEMPYTVSFSLQTR